MYKSVSVSLSLLYLNEILLEAFRDFPFKNHSFGNHYSICYFSSAFLAMNNHYLPKTSVVFDPMKFSLMSYFTDVHFSMRRV